MDVGFEDCDEEDEEEVELEEFFTDFADSSTVSLLFARCFNLKVLASFTFLSSADVEKGTTKDKEGGTLEDKVGARDLFDDGVG